MFFIYIKVKAGGLNMERDDFCGDRCGEINEDIEENHWHLLWLVAFNNGITVNSFYKCAHF